MRRQQGFTLFEIMLVMALMGLVISGVMLTVSSAGPDQDVKRQAFRFKVAMTLALDRALLTGEELGLVVTDSGYQFVRWENFEWTPIEGEKALAPYELEGDLDMELELSLEGLPWQQDSLFESDDGLFEELFKDEEEEEKLIPQVFIYSHGEFTDFNLMFHWHGEEPFTINAAGLTYKVELLDEEEIERVEAED